MIYSSGMYVMTVYEIKQKIAELEAQLRLPD